MLKGILFVLAIIITFDIGKALLKSWQAEEEAPAVVKEVVVDTKSESDVVKSDEVKSEEAELDKALEDVPVLLNLELPEEMADVYAHELEQETDDNKASTSYSSPQKLTQNEKKSSLSLKPIVTFDEEAVEKPRIDGATVDIKVKID